METASFSSLVAFVIKFLRFLPAFFYNSRLDLAIGPADPSQAEKEEDNGRPEDHGDKDYRHDGEIHVLSFPQLQGCHVLVVESKVGKGDDNHQQDA